MTQRGNKPIEKLPIIKNVVALTKNINLPGMKGLKLYDLLELYIYGIIKGTFSYRAGAIAFSFFLALFPFALFLLNLIPYIPVDNFQDEFLHFVEENVPPTTFGAIESILVDIMNNSYQPLLSWGGIMTIFFMANGMNTIIGGFESSYHLSITRNFFKQYLVAAILSVVLCFFFVLSLALYFSVGFILQEFSEYKILLNLFRYAFLMIMFLIGISTLYKFSAKETMQLAFISSGSIFTTLLVGASSYGFGIYVIYFSKYNELYGSIGTLLVIMIYIWLNCLILLLGFDLNATIFKLKQKKGILAKEK
ncbi:YihY/virulence factor BrkB family protein [Capnocytophaga sp. ARDL2]|uniref:YihY/virulence factor BrkB family protein n=1 Tax=Capnocytophaga sp. ARDL2 TaxID=3238809 RepID=UPI003555E182